MSKSLIEVSLKGFNEISKEIITIPLHYNFNEKMDHLLSVVQFIRFKLIKTKLFSTISRTRRHLENKKLEKKSRTEYSKKQVDNAG